MQFKVPQFIDIEDKIFGPFTFREFVYLAGGGGICFVLYKVMGLLYGFIPMGTVAGFSLALTFYKPNNKPFIYMLEAGFKYFTQDKLYIWKKYKETKKEQINRVSTMQKDATQKNMSRLGTSKLKDLAWSLDVLDNKKQEN